MVANADVVLENLGPKRALALNVAASVAPAEHPHLLAVSSSGFGQDGPQASYRAYAYNLQASCALGYLTRTVAGDSAEIDIAWADLISAYALGVVIGAPTIAAFAARVPRKQLLMALMAVFALGNLASELSDVHEGFRQRLAEIFVRWRATLARALRRSQAAGRLSRCPEAARPTTPASPTRRRTGP
jgi:MFS family permease